MRYLLATDGSRSACKAAAWLDQNLPHSGEHVLFLVYVFPLPEDIEVYRRVADLPRDPSDERIREAARHIFEETRGALDRWEGTIHEILLLGNPAHEILEFASTQSIDLLVTGSSGRGPRAEICLGSVSNALAHRSLSPVLVVR
ncbi:MAG: universal stress protein [bacterium]